MSSEAEAKAYLRRLYDDPAFALHELITIVPKNGKPKKFELWESQAKFLQYKSRINEVIKVRQQGFSVLVLAYRMVLARLYENRDSLVFNFQNDATVELFKRVRYYDKMLPEAWQGPKYHDASRQIHYKDTNSLIRIETAGATAAQATNKGRSTTPTDILITEAGYIKPLEDLLTGILGSAHDGTEITMESTSSGPRGYFSMRYGQTMREGEQLDKNIWRYGDRTAFFFGLLEHPEYRMPAPKNWKTESEEEERLCLLGASPETLMWRRSKLNDWAAGVSAGGMSPEERFKREYPACPQDAFESAGGAYFPAKTIMAIWDYHKQTAPKPLTIGLIKAQGESPKHTLPDNANRFTIWRLPIKGYKGRYVFFSDCGQGLPESDFDVGYIGDLMTREVVAKYSGRLGAELNTWHMLMLCNYYDNAKLAFDVSGIGAECRPLLLKSTYPNLWTRYECPNIYLEPEAVGLVWNKSVKSEACSRMKQAITGREWTIYDDEFKAESEYFGFQDPDAVNPEAAEGFTDDHVMALAGLIYVADRLPQPVSEAPPKIFDDANKLAKMRRDALSRSQQARQEIENANTNWSW